MGVLGSDRWRHERPVAGETPTDTAWWKWTGAGEVVAFLKHELAKRELNIPQKFAKLAEEDAITGALMVQMTEEEVKEHLCDKEPGKELVGLKQSKVIYAIIRALPYSSTGEKIELYCSAGDTLAVVFALILGVVLTILSGTTPEIGCDGVYDGDRGTITEAMCYATCLTGIINFIVTGCAAVACAISPSIIRNLRTQCSAPVADYFATECYAWLRYEWLPAMLLAPVLLLLQLGSWAYLSQSDKNLGSMILIASLIGVVIVFRHFRFIVAYSSALKWQEGLPEYPCKFWHWGDEQSAHKT